jgi:uncharacterized protein (TIGR03067 family)
MSDALVGRWEMTRAEQDGAASPELLALQVVLELGADTYRVSFAGRVADQGTYTLAGSTLTLVGRQGPNAGRTIPCLLQLRGSLLRVCYGLDGTAPTAFTTAAGSGRYLATYRRASD